MGEEIPHSLATLKVEFYPYAADNSTRRSNVLSDADKQPLEVLPGEPVEIEILSQGVYDGLRDGIWRA